MDKSSSKFGSSGLAGNKVKELKDVLKGKKDPHNVGASDPSEPATETSLPEADRVNLEAEIKVLEEKLKAAEDESKKNHNDYLRVLAEFDNFRKRMEREKEDIVKFGNEKLLKEFLPVFDHLEMTVEHAVKAGENDETKDSIEEGVSLVVKQFSGVLEKFGVREIAGEGLPFNPNLQEAIGSVASDEIEAGHVVSVHRKGFSLNGRLIRPAVVTIAKAPESEDGANNEEEKTVH